MPKYIFNSLMAIVCFTFYVEFLVMMYCLKSFISICKAYNFVYIIYILVWFNLNWYFRNGGYFLVKHQILLSIFSFLVCVSNILDWPVSKFINKYYPSMFLYYNSVCWLNPRFSTLCNCWNKENSVNMLYCMFVTTNW